jgi:hypothetical protein
MAPLNFYLAPEFSNLIHGFLTLYLQKKKKRKKERKKNRRRRRRRRSWLLRKWGWLLNYV